MNQGISYTAFNKAETITDTLSDGTLRKIQYVYGLDQQRRESIYTEGSTTTTKYYFGDYEEVSDGTSTQKYFYIDAPTGLSAIYVIDGSGTGALNYMFNDHLGSITKVIYTSTGLITHQSFDTWGNAMSSTSWTSMAKYTLFIDRCFYRPQLVPIYLKTTTGNRFEKYVERSEIPIAESVSGNGRMYDPVLGRFLSPDPFVQMPDFSQSFNRYGYCLNNPLKYTDPSGELFFVDDIIIGSVTGTIRGLAKSDETGWSKLWDGFIGGIKGGVVGAVGGGLSMIGGAGMSFAANIGIGTAEGAFTGGLDAAMWGNNVGQGMLWGAAGGALMTTVTSENMNNLFKGEGFYTNENVFNHMIDIGMDKQSILDYFGFKGTYNSSAKPPSYAGGGGSYYGFTEQNGEINYGDYAFSSYEKLKITYIKESYHSTKVLSGQTFAMQEAPGEMAIFPEERLGFIYAYKNQGLALHSEINLLSQIRYYQFQSFNIDPADWYLQKWWHFIYKIPRRW
jgi:RHS repeat-associated protein